jgi:tetratricopeptide (TPR) repeat protein
MLSTERWQRIEQVYEAAVDLPEDERAGVLARECGNDAELRAEVDRMLAARDSSDYLAGLIGGEVANLAKEEAAPMLGRRIGPYVIVGELGRGGMGMVYRAERHDEYRTIVAIKVLPRGLATAHAMARFRDERQILAALVHPGIVRLLDGGTTEDDLPYLVMEYVDGVSITKFVRDLPVRRRVEVVRDVCAAVQYAHQRLVVHRDLKPSNILVTSDATPKLLDFGIAKLLDDDGREAHTRTGTHLMTPEYASPEQARGEPVSVAADIYALGALLYELLADAPAHRFNGATGLAALSVILDVVPPRPSTVAPTERRRALTGDLDNICMKALAKEPELRYASVEQLAEDLRRHLNGLPVQARAQTWRYRAAKFVRRNGRLIAAATIAAVSLAGASAVSLHEARLARDEAVRAQRRFDDVRKLANTLVFQIDDTIKDIVGTTKARELIVSSALGYLDSLAREATGDPALARELASAYLKIGDIQGNWFFANLGQPRDALESYGKADALAKRLPEDDATRWLRVRIEISTSSVRTIDEPERAEHDLAELMVRVERLASSPSFDDRTAMLGYTALFVAELNGDADAATLLRSAQTMVDHGERWAGHDRAGEARYYLGVAYEVRGIAEEAVADPDAAVVDTERAIDIFRELVTADPDVAKYRRELAASLSQRLAAYLQGFGNGMPWTPSVGDRDAGERVDLEALPILEQLVERDRANTIAVVDLATTLVAHGDAVIGRDPASALAAYERALAAYAATPASARASGQLLAVEWEAHCAIADALARAGRPEAARAEMRDGEARAAAASGPYFLAKCRYRLARAELTLGDRSGARQLLEQAAGELRDVIAHDPADAVARSGLVATLEALMRIDAAECRDVLAAWDGWPGATTPFIAAERNRLRSLCKVGGAKKP